MQPTTNSPGPSWLPARRTACRTTAKSQQCRTHFSPLHQASLLPSSLNFITRQFGRTLMWQTQSRPVTAHTTHPHNIHSHTTHPHTTHPQHPLTHYPPTHYPPTQHPPTHYPPTHYPPTHYPSTQHPLTQCMHCAKGGAELAPHLRA